MKILATGVSGFDEKLGGGIQEGKMILICSVKDTAELLFGYPCARANGKPSHLSWKALR